MKPRIGFALAASALVAIAGLAYIGTFASGTIVVFVRDAPIEWDQLNVRFSDVQVHRADAGDESGWISLPLTSPSIDFMALGELTEQLALHRAPAGKYTQIRIVVSSVDGMLADGTPVSLMVPDGVLKTVTPFNLTGGGSTTITLDLDLDASIHPAGDSWIFRPVLGAVQIS
ncbi:MAG TPA: DUF4382 domain-containing protein [Thermoplasmata archaeon]|nr:DUF4382 domain-containing protein [Thermoplasmata archaeon]